MSNETTPLFPLSTVLFPDGVLPLQLFEVRYLDMIRKCLRDGTGFGVVSLMGGAETHSPGEKIQLAKYGTLVTIDKVDASVSNLIKITVKGAQRFELLAFEQQKNSLWTGEIKLLPADPVVEIPDDLKACADALAELISSLDEKEIPEEQLPFSKPYRLMDCGWVSNRWCELFPLDPTVKIQLLALDSPLLRLELIGDQLQAQGLIKPN